MNETFAGEKMLAKANPLIGKTESREDRISLSETERLALFNKIVDELIPLTERERITVMRTVCAYFGV